MYEQQAKYCGNELQYICHSLAVSSGWWKDLKTGEDMRNLT